MQHSSFVTVRAYSDTGSVQGCDYLLSQLAADKKISTLESLPAEILAPILEELHLNSVAGVRALASVSRTFRALTSPYFFIPLKCTFKELVPSFCLERPPAVLMKETDNSTILKFDIDPRPGPDLPVTITQVLNVGNTYECLEYLPNRSEDHLNLSVPALDLLNLTLPLLSRLVIDLGNFIGYSACWDKAYKKAMERDPRSSSARWSDIDATDIICAIARFPNVHQLTLHYKLQRDQVALMHPKIGREVMHELFEFIQGRKRGEALVRFDVCFYTESRNIFRGFNCSWYKDSTTSATMTITCNNDTSSRSGKQSKCKYTCNNPHYGKVLGRRKRVERLYGENAWSYRFGGIQQKITQNRRISVPRCIVMELLLWLAVLPSYLLFFENGKLARYEPSLADVEIRCRKDFSKRRTRLKERIVEVLLCC